METSETIAVHLDGYLDVPDSRLEAVRLALPEHLSLTRAEIGCISFEVTESQAIAGRFLVSEAFVDRAALDAHQRRTNASQWFKITEGIPRHYSTRAGN
jgi:quinol monooxygenase YgiN